jgi:hypothetical protein
VADEGVVQTWSWVAEPVPVPDQPLDRPFAFAMILLDGGGHAPPACGRSGLPRRHPERDAGEGALGCRDGGGDHGHRVLLAGGRGGWAAAVSKPGRRRFRDRRCASSSTSGCSRPRHRDRLPRPPRLRLRRVPRGVEVLPRAGRGAHPGPALPDLPQGLRASSRGVSRGRRADHRRGGAARQGHGDHVLHRQRPVHGAEDRAARTSRPTSCSTAPTSPSCTWSSTPRPTRSGWGCASQPA